MPQLRFDEDPLGDMRKPNYADRYQEYLQSGGEIPFEHWMNIGGPPSQGLEYAHLRQQPGANQEALAPVEHRGIAYDTMRDSPVAGLPALMMAIPAYTGAKYMHLLPEDEKTTPASLREMAEAYRGMWKGLGQNISDWLHQ